MNGPEILQCKEWRGEEAFPERELNKFVIDGIEEIAGDLSNHSSWNGTKPIGTIVLGTGEDSQITSTILHLLGKITDKFVDAKHLWQGAREGSHFKISSLDLSTITFRGSLASSYLSSRDFIWVYRIPSKSTPGKYHEIKKEDLARYGITSDFWLRVLAQPWINGMIKISGGIIPIDDVTTLSNYNDFRCPLVEVFSLCAPLYPRPDWDVPTPCIPYLLDQRADKELEFMLPPSNVVVSTMIAMFKNQTKPNLKKSLWEKARTEDWNIGELCRYTTSDQAPAEDDAESDPETLGEFKTS